MKMSGIRPSGVSGRLDMSQTVFEVEQRRQVERPLFSRIHGPKVQGISPSRVDLVEMPIWVRPGKVGGAGKRNEVDLWVDSPGDARAVCAELKRRPQVARNPLEQHPLDPICQ